MGYTSHLAAASAAFDDAVDKALFAAATVVQNEVKRRLRGGYTTGDFVTGNVVNSVTISPVRRDALGAHVLVGTNVRYALDWELGHLNIFMDGPIEGVHGVRSGPIRRREIWRPALFESRDRQARAFARVMQRFGGSSAPGGG